VTAYLAMFSVRFRSQLQYRAAALAGLLTQVFWGLMRIMVFTAFYRNSDATPPIALADLVTYVWLSQAMLRLLPWRADPELEALVRTGNVAYELLRPVDLYGLWYCRSLAAQTAPTILRAVPMMVIALLCLGMKGPATWQAFLAWAVATAAAALLSGAIATFLSITMMWTLSGRGIASLVNAGVWLFSGMVLPLPLYPEWMKPILNLLPFRGLMDTPIRLYLGQVDASAAPGLIAHQFIWIAAIVLLSRMLLNRGKRRLIVQGG